MSVHQTGGGCPAAPRQVDGGWALTSHAHVVGAAEDPETFSSAVSRHLQIPNGLDGSEHARWRRFVESWFTLERMADVEPVLRAVAQDLVEELADGAVFDAVQHLGSRYAVRATCEWLGWPSSVEDELLEWMARNVEATRSGDHTRTAAVADEFDRFITRMVEAGPAAHGLRVTDEVAAATVDGAVVGHDEVVSILRNWTAGDLSSVALCVGVVLQTLADRPEVQAECRRRVDDDSGLDRAIDEILRIDDPFVVNRRVATRDVRVGETAIAAGSRVLLDWTAANRDPERFDSGSGVDEFAPEANAEHNLVYGRGPHVCPGRPLASLELRTLLRAVLRASTQVERAGEPVRSLPPLGGWASAPLRLRR
ncbi:cytochrome P450 [Nocardioides malaquae]|uniref:cytochrome P450 n=1 Tax=Nocardioides malaquae TaxID=2773426 RepID=UPI0029D416F8|nr:cytochrome P450 [Nocardioides malaquae]